MLLLICLLSWCSCGWLLWCSDAVDLSVELVLLLTGAVGSTVVDLSVELVLFGSAVGIAVNTADEMVLLLVATMDNTVVDLSVEMVLLMWTCP